MDNSAGRLIYFCGKMAAGKSTEAHIVAERCNGVLIAEDEWLAALYPNKINSFEDYIHYSGLLKPLIKSHVQNILKTKTNVVMDFPANTNKQRAWFSKLVQEIGASSELTYLKISNDLCLIRLAKRRIEQPARKKFDTEIIFNQVVSFFEEPCESEVSTLIEVKKL